MSYHAQHRPFSNKSSLCLHTNLLVGNAIVMLCAVLCQSSMLIGVCSESMASGEAKECNDPGGTLVVACTKAATLVCVLLLAVCELHTFMWQDAQI